MHIKEQLQNSGILLIVQLLCIIYSLIVLIPILWSFVSSFRPSLDFFMNPMGLPSAWKYQNFAYAWNQGSIALFFRNSVFVTTISVTVIILFSAMASFALSRLNFRGRVTILFLFISGLFIPSALVLLPLFLMLNAIHILDSYAGLIPVYIAYSFPFTVFLLVPFFNAIPEDLEDAAFVDGASYYQVFWRVALPLVKPGLLVAAIFNVFGIWNEFVLGYVLIHSTSLKTIPLGMADILMNQRYTANYGVLFASITIAVAPIAIGYFVFQRKLTGGMLKGALKE